MTSSIFLMHCVTALRLEEDDLMQMGTKDLKRVLATAGVDQTGFLEKKDFLDAALKLVGTEIHDVTDDDLNGMNTAQSSEEDAVKRIVDKFKEGKTFPDNEDGCISCRKGAKSNSYNKESESNLSNSQDHENCSHNDCPGANSHESPDDNVEPKHDKAFEDSEQAPNIDPIEFENFLKEFFSQEYFKQFEERQKEETTGILARIKQAVMKRLEELASLSQPYWDQFQQKLTSIDMVYLKDVSKQALSKATCLGMNAQKYAVEAGFKLSAYASDLLTGAKKIYHERSGKKHEPHDEDL